MFIHDQEFLLFYPQECNFKLNLVVTPLRGKRPICKSIISNSEEISLTNLADILKTGDRIVLEVENVSHISSSDIVQVLKPDELYLNININ